MKTTILTKADMYTNDIWTDAGVWGDIIISRSVYVLKLRLIYLE